VPVLKKKKKKKKTTLGADARETREKKHFNTFSTSMKYSYPRHGISCFLHIITMETAK